MNLRLTLTAAIATVAASIALYPLIASTAWFWEAAGAVVVVAAVASVARVRTLPVVICVLTTALGLLIYLNLVFSSQHSFGGLLPTGASLAGLVRLNSTGWSEAARFAPPVPGLRGVTFLAVAGVGLAALLTDLLAVRLRKAAAAGLPLLALFSATVASKASTTTTNEAVIFCAGVAGYLVLLLADGRERIQQWGDLVLARHAGWPPPEPTGQGSSQRQDPRAGQHQEAPVADTRALAAAGRRVGMAAMAAALLVPLLIPGLHVRDLFGGGADPGALGSGSRVTLPDPVVQLNLQLHRTQARTVLTYHSDNPDPPYLRVYALDLSPATGSWALYPHQITSLGPDGQVPGAPGLQTAQSRLTRTSVTVAHGVTGTVFSGLRTGTFLPLPYPPVRVRAGGGWAVDPDTLMMWSANSISGLGYNVTSKDVEPTPQELRDAPPPSPGTAREAMLPTAYSSMSGLADQLTRGAVTPYDKAVALQRWFTAAGNFTYSLNGSVPDTVAGLEDFLLHTKRGFCQQFAFAFAVLARLLGIPARVAVGYTAGTDLGEGDWRITTSDAHAWPELFFQGAGWLRWEPTPSGIGAGQGTAKPPIYTVSAGSTTGPGGAPGQTSTGGTGPPPGQSHSAAVWQQRSEPYVGPTGVKLANHSYRQWLWWLLLPAALALIILLLPLGTRLLTRLRRMLIIVRGTEPGRSRDGAVARPSGAGPSAARVSGADQAGQGLAGEGPGGAGSGGTGPGGGALAVDAASKAARACVHAAWLEIHDDLEDFGLGCAATESPRAVVHRVTAELRLPQAPRDALARVAFAEERARYAAKLARLPALRTDVTAVRRAVAASVSLRARWRARVFPASKLSALRRSARHALDVFGWIEIAISWLPGHLRPGRDEAEMDSTAAP